MTILVDIPSHLTPQTDRSDLLSCMEMTYHPNPTSNQNPNPNPHQIKEADNVLYAERQSAHPSLSSCYSVGRRPSQCYPYYKIQMSGPVSSDTKLLVRVDKKTGDLLYIHEYDQDGKSPTFQYYEYTTSVHYTLDPM